MNVLSIPIEIFLSTVSAGTCYVCDSSTNSNCVWEGFDTSSMKPQECGDSYGGQCFKQTNTTAAGSTSVTVGKGKFQYRLSTFAFSKY